MPRKKLPPSADLGQAYTVLSATLVNIQLKLGVEYQFDDEDVALFYGMRIGRPGPIAEGSYTFQAHARAGTYVEGEKAPETAIEATYAILIGTDVTDEAELLRIAEHCAKYVVWGRYSIWFAATAAQLPDPIPPLPLFVEEIVHDETLDYAEDEEDEE